MRLPPVYVNGAGGQTLSQHLHLRCLVAAGALAPDGHWISSRRGFLFPVTALSPVFRG